jgi:competence protein ComEC
MKRSCIVPLFWLSVSFLCGILLAEILGGSPATWLFIGSLFIGILIVQWGLSRLFPVYVGWTSRLRSYLPAWLIWFNPPIPVAGLFILIALGGARYQSVQPMISSGDLAWYNDSEYPYIVEGVLVKPPEVYDTSVRLIVSVDQLHPDDSLLFEPVEGLLLAQVPASNEWRYGDRIRLRGILRTPDEDETFSFKEYLARQNIYTVLYCSYETSKLRDACAVLVLRDQGNALMAMIYRLKEHSLDMVYQLFPDPEASLLAGILLGVESGIPDSVQDAFMATGTSHIIVISGANFAVIAGVLILLFRRLLGRWRGMLVALVGMATYAILVGGEPAVVRAAILVGFVLLGRQLGRRQHGVNSLAFVAALMALVDPYVLWDVSFQLSFAATLGLVLYAEPLSHKFIEYTSRHLTLDTSERLARPVGEYFLFTLAAQVITLPVILYHFQRLSLSSILANPLILPAQPPIMVMGGLAVLLGTIYLPLGKLAAYAVWPFVGYTIRMVELLAQMPSATWVFGRVGLWVVVAFYVLLFAGTFANQQLRERLSRLWQDMSTRWLAFGVATLVTLSVVVWRVGLSVPDGYLHLTVLDTNTETRSGEAILIQTPAGRNLLVNGGPSSTRLSDALGRRLPLTHRKLDYLVIAGTETQQVDALPLVLERFPADQVLWAGAPAGNPSALRLRSHLSEMQISITPAQAGHVLDLGDGARLQVLTVDRRGAVLLLEWGNFSALLPVGITFESWEKLFDDHELVPVTVLLLAQNGTASLNTLEWIGRWQPQLLLLSVAAGDESGKPDPETIQSAAGYSLLRTDQNGWIHLHTDGKTMWVDVERR